jgi:hypothetical protein
VRVARWSLGTGLLSFLLPWQDNGRKLLDVLRHSDARYLLAVLVIALGLNRIISLKRALPARR